MIEEINRLFETPWTFPFSIIGLYLAIAYILRRVAWDPVFKPFFVSELPIDGETFYFKSMGIWKFGGFNQCLTIRLSSRGLGIKMLPILPFYPKVLIPWGRLEFGQIQSIMGLKAIKLKIRGLAHPQILLGSGDNFVEKIKTQLV